MKKTIKFLVLACFAVSMIACNKAKFVDANIVTFSSNRATVTEDSGIITIPVLLYGADECVVTYAVSEETALSGVHYEVVDRQGNPNNTGVLTISNVDKAVNDSIRIKITDLTGTDTGNLTFSITLKESAEDNIHVGAFNSCRCTIIDNDGGLAKMIGYWEGSGNDTNGKSVEFTFMLQDYDPSTDPDAEYPEANCMLTDGNMQFASNGNQMSFAAPLYAYYDKNMAKLHVYGLQFFNAYNFGSDLGVCYVAWGTDAGSWAELLSKPDIIINAGDGVLELDADILMWLCDSETGEPNGYTAGSLAGGYTWTKK